MRAPASAAGEELTPYLAVCLPNPGGPYFRLINYLRRSRDGGVQDCCTQGIWQKGGLVPLPTKRRWKLSERHQTHASAGRRRGSKCSVGLSAASEMLARDERWLDGF